MKVIKIDGHRHVLQLEAVAAASKLNPVKSSHIYPSGLDERSEMINREKGVGWNRKMSNLGENIADMDTAGLDVGVLQPTQTMFFYWAEPSAAAELSRMVDEFTAEATRKHPERFVGLATVPLQDVNIGQGIVVCCQESWSERSRHWLQCEWPWI